MGYSIAIDGPAGAGKSTIAKMVAKRKGFIYIDTGAMYRAMALYLLRRGIGEGEQEKISEKCKEADITIRHENGEQVILLNGENVSPLIRTEEVGNMASASSVNKDVREKLVELQRRLADSADVVMDGRDIGTIVLPGADVKVYLTADSSVRAKRRFDELTAKGEHCDLAKIERDIVERDKRDMSREISPLRQAEDAVLVDSSSMTTEEVAKAILELCEPFSLHGKEFVTLQ
ncbi:(d)CMP kinase [Kineothrix sedimenti]|uniref:Cytidylate kinase n=1 Tax=Kineothrix sedimenti TaxID=3123317 RepID=A0ABZ3EQX7_9FIRM